MMRPSPGRARIALPVAGLILLSACSQSPRDRLNSDLADREDELPSCAANGCAEEVAVLATALAKLPGVVRVVKPGYRAAQITDGANLTGSLVVEAGVECDGLEEQAAELAWKSSVSPLMGINLGCATEGSDLSQENAGYVYTEVRPQSREQLEQWGDRGTLRPPG